VGNARGEGGRRNDRAVLAAQDKGRPGWGANGDLSHEFELAGHVGGFWADADWIFCRDGKTRPIEPGVFPLANGHSGRVAVVRSGEQAGTEVQEAHWYNRSGALKCIGNAIVPQVAATFIEAALGSIRRIG
jgi:DNA (cytosine-5)-methyltransferase 1